MSKKRISNFKGTTSAAKKIATAASEKLATRGAATDLKVPSLSIQRKSFLGLALGGGKTDKTCLAHVEYFTDQKKIFLNEIQDKIKPEGDISSDLILYEKLIDKNSHIKDGVSLVAYNVPLTLPKCVTCKLKCPGYEACNEDEIQWMWEHYRQLEARGEVRKLFTPYTERCVEHYLATELEEVFHVQQALGANFAPLTARAQFLNRRLKFKTIEVHPRLSLWRIGSSLQIQKSHLRHHKHQAGGDESRQVILQELIRRAGVFIYEQDVRLMMSNANAFDAFICALTAVLKVKGQCEGRPKDFPKNEGWIEIPKEDIVW